MIEATTHSLDSTIPSGQDAIATRMLQRSTERTLLIHMVFVNLQAALSVVKKPHSVRRANARAGSRPTKKTGPQPRLQPLPAAGFFVRQPWAGMRSTCPG
ncbi:hypothetical protein [Denitromonas sp.]|uniref:hypothetical protein n=1 Tax=Denitromonas sp. TaxID=2734609 RepID=UPI002AFF7FE9|nr:hypothetical protein [Denitromonas sp.]